MKKNYNSPNVKLVEMGLFDCILNSTLWYDENINEYGGDDIYGGLL